MFNCPNHSTRIVESDNARFIENGKFSGSDKSHIVDIQKTNDNVSTHVTICRDNKLMFQYHKMNI